MRVSRREIGYLLNALRTERNRLIAEKIAVRDAGGDSAPIRHDLGELRRIYEEVLRALEDIEEMESSAASVERDVGRMARSTSR